MTNEGRAFCCTSCCLFRSDWLTALRSLSGEPLGRRRFAGQPYGIRLCCTSPSLCSMSLREDPSLQDSLFLRALNIIRMAHPGLLVRPTTFGFIAWLPPESRALHWAGGQWKGLRWSWMNAWFRPQAGWWPPDLVSLVHLLLSIQHGVVIVVKIPTPGKPRLRRYRTSYRGYTKTFMYLQCQ